MLRKYTYDEIFQRNIGIFTEEDQAKIKKMTVGIAGVGGLGAPVAENLARLGVGEIKLAEPGKFEASNLNRQTGSYLDTLGKNKAIVMRDFIKKINPECKIEIFPDGINKKNIEEFVFGCDIIIDGIDFFQLEEELLLHKAAKKKGVWVVNAQGAFSIISFIVFDPKKKMLHELIRGRSKMSLVLSAIRFMFPKLPKEINKRMILDFLKNVINQKDIHIPSYSVLVPLSGSIVAQLVINIIIKKRKNVLTAPSLFYVDTNKLEIVRIINE